MISVAPPGWHSVTPRIVAHDAEELVDFLRDVFDATGAFEEERPSQIAVGDSLIMISEADERAPFPAFLYVYVADAEETYQRAIDAGAESLEEVWKTPYGDLRGMVRDRWGNIWQLATKAAQ